jgi:hypothetical protein
MELSMKPSKLAFILVCALSLCAEDNKLTIYMGGKPAATETYSVEKSDNKIEISGTGNAVLGTMKVSIDKFDLIEDSKFQPVSVDAKATMGQMKMAHLVAFAEGKAKDEITMGQGTKTKESDIHPDALVINSTLPLFAWSILAMRAKVDSSDPQTFYAYIIGQGENPVSVISKGLENVEFAGQKADLNHLIVTFKQSAAGDPVTADLWMNDARRIIKIAVPAQSVEAYQDGYAPIPKPEVPDKETKPQG